MEDETYLLYVTVWVDAKDEQAARNAVTSALSMSADTSTYDITEVEKAVA